MLLCLVSPRMVSTGLQALALLYAVSSNAMALSYRYASFATAYPGEAVDFIVKYLDAEPITNASSYHWGEDVKGVRLPYGTNGQQYSDIYFQAPSKRPVPGSLTVGEWEDYLVALHGDMAEDTWDRFLDWHVAFTVSDLDVVAARLIRDGRKFVTRSQSVFVELPHGQIIQVLSAHMSSVWTETFLFCRYTNNSDLPPPIALTVPGSDIEELAKRRVGYLTPSHHSFNTRQAKQAHDFLIHYTDAKTIEPGDDVHEYGNGTCALLKWVQFTESPPYQLHFVDNLRKREGPLTTAFLEDYLTRLHDHSITQGGQEELDDFMANRLGFATHDLESYRKRLVADGVPVLDRGWSILVVVPPGELVLDLIQEGEQGGWSAAW